MAGVNLRVRIHLDKEWRTDPVVEADVSGATLQEVITTAKNLGSELAAYAGAAGVKKIDLVNGHEVLGFIEIPI
jgi:hypothetical protein